ncbi:exosortase-associated protein EpsI, B-type [Chitinivorax sp. B]|uniref:exosortase-associated protein EpsI, B-type n=1 Tax=Chitinivorax sp. B TaxID=2502235 RepID=UPI0010F49E89|nr:exosortase-associated protein EpsI, B-type [Chitinivorax sp. B]
MSLPSLIAGVVMLASAYAAVAMKPTHHMAQLQPIQLQSVIPEKIGEWTLDKTPAIDQINPEVQAKINRIYSQLVQRTYVNSLGHRIMLSIAYGGDQSDALRVHRPEVCYGSQGFQVSQQTLAMFQHGDAKVPIRRLVAAMGNRIEPITYWMTVGEKVALTGWQHKLAQLSYGVDRVIPDGMVFRVSTVGLDVETSYRNQENFLAQLYKSLPSTERNRIFGA